MTTNQTIDGVLVPRELLELAMLELVDTFSWAGELRALLDAPVGQAKPVHEDLRRAWQAGYDTGFYANNPAHERPDAQPQDEPVAIIERARKIEQLREAFEQRFKLDIWPVIDWLRNSGLYAEQPAPVAVVMPERKDPGEYRDASYTQTCMSGEWNACLDELKRLNPSL